MLIAWWVPFALCPLLSALCPLLELFPQPNVEAQLAALVANPDY